MYVLFTLGLGWRNHGGRKSHVHFGVSIDTKSKGGWDTSSRRLDLQFSLYAIVNC